MSMPRDYADSTQRKPKPGSLPGWVWMLGGLAIGLFVAFLVYLNNHTPKSSQDGLGKVISQTMQDINKEANKALGGNDKDKPKEKDKTKDTAAATTTKPAPKFDFYYILPEMEVAVPDQELAKAGSKDKPLDANTSYILQAASFKSPDEADRLKAKLALSGVDATIQSVTINNDAWYRVRVGPFQDVALLNKTRKRLQDNGISAIVVKAK
jgi:cell division protein FtsN